MALPPTRLTQLLQHAGSAPERVLAALVDNRCLTLAAEKDPMEVMALLAAVIAQSEARAPIPGPSTQDLLARALVDSPYLNNKGRKWAGAAP